MESQSGLETVMQLADTVRKNILVKKEKKKHNIDSLRFEQGIGNNQRTEGKEGNRNFFDEAQGF